MLQVVHGQPSSSQEDSKEDEYCKQPPPRIVSIFIQFNYLVDVYFK